jgi:hypothetical protein
VCQNNIILYRVQSYICSVISFSDKLNYLPHIIHVVPLKEIIYPICNKAVAFSGDFRRFGEMCIKTFRRKRNGAINLMQDICHILYWETSEQTSTLHSSLYSNLFCNVFKGWKMYINHMLRREIVDSHPRYKYMFLQRVSKSLIFSSLSFPWIFCKPETPCLCET